MTTDLKKRMLSLAFVAFSQNTLAGVISDTDQLVGSWQSKNGGGTVLIQKNKNGTFDIRGQDDVSSWNASCKTENISLICSGSGYMFSDYQQFLYRTVISVNGKSVSENWRVNTVASPDGEPVNSGKDLLIRIKVR